MAGNTSLEMRSTGVAILNMPLKTSTINKAQHEKLYKNYFKYKICNNTVYIYIYIYVCMYIYVYMEREIVLSSYSVKTVNNKPENFTTKFTRPITLDSNVQYAIGLNIIINMSFTWFNINPGYNNQFIKYFKNNGTSFIKITFPAGVWDYSDINQHIKEITVIKQSNKDDEYPINVEFNESTFRVTITMKQNYQLDLTHSNFYELIGFGKKKL